MRVNASIFFINQGLDEKGVPHFKDLAQPLGLADSSYSTQATFFDYDLDNDLDMYLLTNSLEVYHRNSPVGQRMDGSGKSVDKLYRQDTSADGTVHFTDVSTEAGILEEGWGLGIVANDFNQDGWPDIYCANDFLSSDHLYINQHDGTFKNEISAWMNHQEFNGMGTDMADLNNDALNDLVVVDMMPDDNLRQKTMFSGMGYNRFMMSLRMKYQPQYIRNVLQRNNGNNTFSDIGYQSGIYATDWSWSPLIADFDNDGLRDIFISNGYLKDITDLDFVTYNKEVTMFGTDSLKKENAAKALNELKGVYKHDFLFRNKGDFHFEDVAASSGLSDPTYTNGAAYADFDNDGDLDLISNNLNGVARLYENTTNSRERVTANFLQVRMRGPGGNPLGIGTRIWVYAHGQLWYGEQQVQCGYLSSVDPAMHFGLGHVTKADSVVIVWPGNRMEKVLDIPANTRITASYDNAKLTYSPAGQHHSTLLAEQETVNTSVMPEDDYVDYKYGQATLPHKFSQQGPRLTVGDVNGDGQDDFIVGGSAHHGAMIYLQGAEGKFHVDSLAAKESEDIGLKLFDADKDGDLDLYCVSGSSEFGKSSSFYQDRLYKNNGKGKFQLDDKALPKIESSGSCVSSADFDHDGDLDLFVGGRVVPSAYPSTPRSYLLKNNEGNFEDVTGAVGSELSSAGMVTDALFTDFDSDGWDDLIVVGEWMPVTVFHNERGSFRKVKELMTGWWSSIGAGDFDNDGDTDYIVGNLGKNTVFQASEREPVSIYAKDFDANGSLDPFMSRYIDGKEYPVHYRETMTEQIPALRRILKTYSQYGQTEMGAILKFLGPQDMIEKHATWFESSYMENQGNGNFSLHALPFDAQVSPITSVTVCHLNDDAYLDFLAVGNSFSEETLSGYYDAGTGVCALGRGDGTFEIVSPAKSGFCVRTDAKAIAEIVIYKQRSWVICSNSAPLKFFANSKTPKTHFGNLNALKNAGRRSEPHPGGSYLSQAGNNERKDVKVVNDQ